MLPPMRPSPTIASCIAFTGLAFRGTEERRNGGTEERRNGGTEERWNGGTVERSSTDDQSQVIPMFDSRTFADIRVPTISNQIRRERWNNLKRELPRIHANVRE